MSAQDLMGPHPSDIVVRDADVFIHQAGSSPCMATVRKVEGIWLELEDGRRLIDLHGNSVHHIGHAHPELIAALKAQLETLPFAPRRYTNEPAVLLAEKLTARWPGPRAKVLFATGGSDVIEIALKLARVATGRSETVSLAGSYHGHGFGAFGLSAAETDPRLGPFLPGRWHITPYWRADLGGAERMIEDLQGAFARSAAGIAAVIAEPIRSNCHVPPPTLWREVQTLCKTNGALLIFDEIPSGLAKTGRFFAFEHFGVVPDAVVLGKALGGGAVPIAAVIADASLDVAPELSLGHYTHEKNPLTARAALTTIGIIERDGLTERAARLGERASAWFAERATAGAGLKGSRGLGLLMAVELDRETFPAGTDPATTVAAACFQNGVSTTTKGPDAIGFSPPLTISPAELELAIERIEQAIGNAVSSHARRC